MDKPDPQLDRGQLGEAKKAGCGVIVAGGHSPTIFQLVEKPFDPVSHRKDRAIDRALDFAIPLGRDFGHAAACSNRLPDRVTIVSLVAEQDVGVSVVCVHQLGKDGAVMCLAGRQDERDWKTLSVGPGVDFGRKATA